MKDDRISALPEDLLVQILSLVPTKEAMATTMLSKRWRSVWKMLPRLEYTDAYDESNVWSFVGKSLLQLNKAPTLEKLRIHTRASCPVNVDVEKLVDNVVERCIQWLDFSLRCSAKPKSLSKSLYTCKTLKKLRLSDEILVDVPSQASLPSLVQLGLHSVIYKNEDSLIRLLSSCPLLQKLFVERDSYVNDNVTNFIVKVPSLQLLRYRNYYHGGSLVIDCPGLKIFHCYDYAGHACLIENMPPCLDMAKVYIDPRRSDKFLTSLSSVKYLKLTWKGNMNAICSSGINFSRLIECKLTPFASENWVETIMHLLRNSPELKLLRIKSGDIDVTTSLLSLSSYVPECLSSRLEVFEWKSYGGTREEEELLTYILAKSKCLTTVRIFMNIIASSNKKKKMKNKKKRKMMKKEIELIPRVSESSQLFFSTKVRRGSIGHPAYLDIYSYSVT